MRWYFVRTISSVISVFGKFFEKTSEKIETSRTMINVYPWMSKSTKNWCILLYRNEQMRLAKPVIFLRRLFCIRFFEHVVNSNSIRK